MVLMDGGSFLMGSEGRDQSRRRGGSGSGSNRVAVLARRDRRHQQAVRNVRQSDRLRDRVGALRVVVRVRGTAAARCSPNGARCGGRVVGPGQGREPGAPRRDRPPGSGTGRTTRSSTSHTTTHSPTATGPARAFRRKPSGSSRHAGGLAGALYPWGDELTPKGKWRCNIWQGAFPQVNSLDDGHIGPAPVRTYPRTGSVSTR